MALLALIHSSEGPIVKISRIRNPAVRVTSLPQGASLLVIVRQESGAVSSYSINANGDHPIGTGEWLQVTYEGAKSHKTICCIVNKAA